MDIFVLPKEKAKQLMSTFGASTMSFEKGAFNKGMTLPFDIAKKISIICVAEILHQVADTGKKTEGTNYWSLVKEELENLN